MIETPGPEADEIAAPGRARRAPASFARLGGLARRLFSTRLDKSAGRIRFSRAGDRRSPISASAAN